MPPPTTLRGRLAAGVRRASVVPFEMAIALLLTFSGITALLHVGLVDPVSVLLPGWEALTLNVMTTLSGAMMIAGVLLSTASGEAAGLLFLITVVAARFLLYGHYLDYGGNLVLTGVLDSAVIAAGVCRLVTLHRRRALIMVESDNSPAGPPGDLC